MMINTESVVASVCNTLRNLETNQKQPVLEELVKGLNVLFEDMGAVCVDAIYTNNTDHMPFGVYVFPVIEDTDMKGLLINGDPFVINKYKIEIDSKMYACDMSGEEMASILIYNIYSMINGDIPSTRVREAIDAYFVRTGSYLQIRETVQYQKILELGVIDTLIKFTNCLYLDSDVVSSPIVSTIGLESAFGDALRKLFDRIAGCDTPASRAPKLIILDWCFRLYSNIKQERYPAMKQLYRSAQLSASFYYKKIFEDLALAVNEIIIDTPAAIEIMESALECLEEGKKGSLFSQIKYNGLRGIEDDFYEFMVRARNAETEEEVMYALKQINVRLSILDDYIRNENLSDAEKERWTSLYIKYCDIRDEIAKKKVYNKKNYGIFFDYNQLDKDDDE